MTHVAAVMGLWIVFGLGVSAGVASTIEFETLPASGIITGSPGSTVGWGYNLTNGSGTDWLVTRALNTGSFVAAVPNLIFDFPVLSPGSMVTVPYDPSIGAGLLELVWDTSAPPSLTNSGTFVLSSEWWTNNPLNGGVIIADAADVSKSYQAVVVSSVPEPSTLLLMSPLCCAVALWRLRSFVMTISLRR